MARRPKSPERKRETPADGDNGPAEWLLPFWESRYTQMRRKPKLSAAEEKKVEAELRERERAAMEMRLRPDGAEAEAADGFRSALRPGRGDEVLADLPPEYWHDVMLEYQKRRVRTRKKLGARFHARIDFEAEAPPAPGVLGANNWVPIGPSVVRRGQPTGRPAISGRASGIAIAPGGTRVYVATADGGVWRSDDAGASWYSTMEAFDLNPTAFGATSLACGAIAIDDGDPDRVYVGTGEGDTNALFSRRLVSALPSYRGVGPLRSDDGGGNWAPEPTATGSPTLLGSAFFALAVDPGDRDNVVGATNVGLYRREPDGAGGYHWAQKRAGVHSSVVVARSGSTTTFFAAKWGDKVYSSPDGSTWTEAGTGFPTGTGRIGLAVQRDNPNVLYAMVADTSNRLLGVYRLDNASGAWRNVSGAPSTILGSQGDYDLTIAVDPGDANRIFMGGQATGVADAAIYRATVTASGSGGSLTYSMSATSVGTGAHADVHVVAFPPGDSGAVWACCDGGVFRTTSPGTAGSFEARNTGLQTMSANYVSQHPTQPAVVFSGFQDNGTGRFTGEECWTHVGPGDGGYPVVNWHDPYKVLVYWNGSVNRAEDGGRDYGSWTGVTPAGAGWYVMAQPLVTTPYNPSSPADAETVAYGAGTSLFVSNEFGSSWTTLPSVSGGLIYSLALASPSRLYAGTTEGRVYRYDLSGGTWTQTRIDNASGGALPLVANITDIAVDPGDATGSSVFVTLGGVGDYRHVWRFDGSAWQQRSGAAGSSTSLLDVEHNAIVVDPDTGDVYAAADIGVWRSTDGGGSWSLLESGLPDAAVLDLQLHRSGRLLRAALHGRGVYEYELDAPTPEDVELYIRDTTLDLGRTPTADGLDDPAAFPVAPVRHYESPNIKVDVPTPAGYQTPGLEIDFYRFNDKLVDGSAGVATLDPMAGTVTNRVFVEVHNRGIQPASSVQVMLLLTPASAGLVLPSGYRSNVLSGTPITAPGWQTVGIKTVSGLRVGAPQVVGFNLPSTMLPPPASLPGASHYCAVAILHSPDDQFTSTQTGIDPLCVADRKVGQKNLHIVQFVGTPPSPGSSTGSWSRLLLAAADKRAKELELGIDLRQFPGRLEVVFPPRLVPASALKRHKPGRADAVKRWASKQRKLLSAAGEEGRFDYDSCRQMLSDIERVESQPLVVFEGEDLHRLPLRMEAGSSQALFLRVAPPRDSAPGASWEFDVLLSSGPRRPLGGSHYRVEVVPEYEKG